MPAPVLIAVIPARCGSKRVRLKNIRPLAGKPLLAHTVTAALESGVFAGVYVSTECREVADAARAAGAAVIDRPEALAGDAASTEAVLVHALEVVAGCGIRPDWIVALPPTSPLRGADVIRAAAAAAADAPADVDALFTVHENRADFWRGAPPASIARLFPDAPRRQQDREPLWEENSALYATRPAALAATGFILGRNRIALPITPLQGLDINTALDFHIVETVMRHLAELA